SHGFRKIGASEMVTKLGYRDVSRARLQLREKPLDSGDEHPWLGGRRVACNDPAIASGEKFREIPLNAAKAEHAEDSRLLLLQKFIKWVGAGAVYVDFGKDGKTDAVIPAAKGSDLLGCARLLPS